MLLALTLYLVSCAPIVVVRKTRPQLPTSRTAPLSSPADVRTAPGLAALGDYLDLARDASHALHYRPLDAGARARYNFAVARFIEIVQDEKLDPWGHRLIIPGSDGAYILKGRLTEKVEQYASDYDFVPADTLTIGGAYFKTPARVDGIGAPLVAIARGETTDYRESFNVRRVYAAFTALIRVSGRMAELDLVQPLQTERITLDNHNYQVAADFSAPIAINMARERPQRLGFIRVFFPDRYHDTARLARLQPYDETRTPVLFVHGLQDTPATWAPMICALLNDVEIRRGYQLWTFSYPSGYPFPYAASMLRRNLNGLSDAFPHHKRIVLVGHSLGGLVVRLMATDSGDDFWRDAFGASPDQTRSLGRSTRFVQDSLIFRHRDDVQRAIFISTPHRGSELASGFIGRLAARLIRAPRFVSAFRDAVLAVATNDRGTILLQSIPNSITTLSPDNWFLKRLNHKPITSPYHSLIGDRGRGDTPNSSDGIVPYWSSHLDGAESEAILPSDHRVQLTPEGIAEVRRILRKYR